MLNKDNSIDFDFYGSGATKSRRYHFLCSNGCGETIKVRTSKLDSHSGSCANCALENRRLRPHEFRYNRMLAGHKAKQMNGEAVSYQEFLGFIGSRCHYCDSPLDWPEFGGSGLGKATNLDRKDSLIGYCSGNIVACCWTCNFFKQDLVSYEAMLEIGPILRNHEIRGRRQGRTGCDKKTLTPEQRAAVSATRSTSQNKTGFRGVHFRKSNQKWCAQIRTLGKNTSLGCFDTAEEAAAGYDKKAYELYGPAAQLNFPLTTPPRSANL